VGWGEAISAPLVAGTPATGAVRLVLQRYQFVENQRGVIRAIDGWPRILLAYIDRHADNCSLGMHNVVGRFSPAHGLDKTELPATIDAIID